LLDLTREESPFVKGASIETWKGVDSEVLSKDEKIILLKNKYNHKNKHSLNASNNKRYKKKKGHCPTSIMFLACGLFLYFKNIFKKI